MTEIYFVATAVLAFLFGMGVQAFIDNRAFRDFREENRALRRKIVALKKYAKKAGKKEIIEIIDNRTSAQPDANLFRPF